MVDPDAPELVVEILAEWPGVEGPATLGMTLETYQTLREE
jgi:hypothetical protein